jgi:hypothetical protein
VETIDSLFDPDWLDNSFAPNKFYSSTKGGKKKGRAVADPALALFAVFVIS